MYTIFKALGLTLLQPKILVPAKASLAIADAIQPSFSSSDVSYYKTIPSPVAALKAIKNATELEGFRQSHIRDGVALARYFAWLEEALNQGKEVNEWEGAEALEGFRKELDLFKGLSFTTISGAGLNGGGYLGSRYLDAGAEFSVLDSHHSLFSRPQGLRRHQEGRGLPV